MYLFIHFILNFILAVCLGLGFGVQGLGFRGGIIRFSFVSYWLLVTA